MSDLRAAIEAAASTSSEETTNVEPIQTEVDNSVVNTPVDSSPSPVVVDKKDSGGGQETKVSNDTGSTEKPTIEEVAGEAGKPVENKDETPEQRETRHRVDRAPQSWKGEAKKLWDQLPLQVRQEVARREKDMLPIMQEAATNRNKVQEVLSVITPHRGIIDQHYGGNPMEAVKTMLGVERVIRTGTATQKAQIVANMIKEFGVDIHTLDSLLVGQQPTEEIQQQSNIEALLEQKLAPFQQFIQTQQQREAQQRQQVEQTAVMTVQEMSQDEKYPYFNEVREDMADLIEMNARRGLYLSLDDAYNRAVRMNTGTFQAAQVRDQSQGTTQAALEAHRAAQAAKGASVSVTGSPTGTGKNSGDPSNLRGLIENAFGGGRL
jgi:hypothetical protein